MGLTKGQVLRLVNEYIGVSNGYLGLPESKKFTYLTHADFYPQYCELDNIEIEKAEGKTTREKFINILFKATPQDQAKIIRGVFKKFPVHCTIPEDAILAWGNSVTEFGIELDQRKDIQKEFFEICKKLEKNSLDDVLSFIKDSNTALKALKDAEVLLKENGAQSALDRVHTIFHSFLISMCKQNSFNFKDKDPITELFKIIKLNHPNFKQNSSVLTNKIIRSFGSIIDTLNPIRNDRSLAHPNEHLLNEEDANFVIESVVLIIKYIASKLD